MNTNTIGTLMDTAHNLPTDEFVLGKSRTIPERKKTQEWAWKSKWDLKSRYIIFKSIIYAFSYSHLEECIQLTLDGFD